MADQFSQHYEAARRRVHERYAAMWGLDLEALTRRADEHDDRLGEHEERLDALEAGIAAAFQAGGQDVPGELRPVRPPLRLVKDDESA